MYKTIKAINIALKTITTLLILAGVCAYVYYAIFTPFNDAVLFMRVIGVTSVVIGLCAGLGESNRYLKANKPQRTEQEPYKTRMIKQDAIREFITYRIGRCQCPIDDDESIIQARKFMIFTTNNQK